MRLLFVFVFLLGVVSCGVNVHIPDAKFKKYLIENSEINRNGDSLIQLSEAKLYSGLIHCDHMGITDLTGIEAFTALTELWCDVNQLTSLDISKNTALTTLSCTSNQLTSLDISKNTALYYLYCSRNHLTSLDVSKNTALITLNVRKNKLSSLDISQNTALIKLYCSYNKLTCVTGVSDDCKLLGAKKCD